MPAIVYLPDYVIRNGHIVPDDKECTDLLKEVNNKSNRNWIIEKCPIRVKEKIFSKVKVIYRYNLYLDCNGEWQIINLMTANGGSIFHGGAKGSRENVMNYLMGLANGLDLAKINLDKE